MHEKESVMLIDINVFIYLNSTFCVLGNGLFGAVFCDPLENPQVWGSLFPLVQQEGDSSVSREIVFLAAKVIIDTCVVCERVSLHVYFCMFCLSSFGLSFVYCLLFCCLFICICVYLFVLLVCVCLSVY